MASAPAGGDQELDIALGSGDRALDQTRDNPSRLGVQPVANPTANGGAPGRVRRNMPDPIPVMILGRLAVDVSVQDQGVGRGLLRDAILRTLNAAEIAGIRAILAHALDETAAAFYRTNGLLDSPIDPSTLMLPLEHARKGLPR